MRVRGRRVGRLARALAALVVATVSTFVALAAPAAAVGIGGPSPFSLTPSVAANSVVRPYFEATLAPGQSHEDTVIVSNDGSKPEKLAITASNGVTAPNTGSAFDGSFGPCKGTACWVRGLPATVELAAGSSLSLPFTVTVPTGAAPRQYLAGITAESAPAARPDTAKGQAAAPAGAVTVVQVSVGVAITVGRATDLRTSLAVPDVTAGTTGSLPRLYARVHNTGQTFSGATGAASCVYGGVTHTWAAVAGTILPTDTATLTVNAPGLPTAGAVTCTLLLSYGQARTARWSGTVQIPTRAGPHRAGREKATGPTGGAAGPPAWLVATLAAAAGVALVLLALVVRQWRRDRRRGRPSIELRQAREDPGAGLQDAPWSPPTCPRNQGGRSGP